MFPGRYTHEDPNERFVVVLRDPREAMNLSPSPSPRSSSPRSSSPPSPLRQSASPPSPSAAAELPDSHYDVESRLPELAPSRSNSTSQSPPPRSPEQVYLLPLSCGVRADKEPSKPVSVSLASDETPASSPQRPLVDADEASALVSNDQTQATSHREASEEAGFTVVGPRKLKLNVKVNSVTGDHTRAYKEYQAVFQSALAASTIVNHGDSIRFDALFTTDTQTQLVDISHDKITNACHIARKSRAWQPDFTLMNALWYTIRHREQAGEWYARLDARDERAGKRKSYQYIISVLKKAWRILNDGVAYDSKRPPTEDTT